MPAKQGLSSLDDGFRVRYLGSLGFPGGSRKPGIQTLQRPMLQLYSTARRRGEDQRSRHPLALTQFLDVSNYGLVVVDIEEDPEDGELTPVITKVITPIENVIMWAAVRFHARPTKKRSMGAAFVPIACSDGVLDKNAFIQLGGKQRFLVSLTHPPLFVCLLQNVASPKSVECHAFVCASAEDSLSICSMVSGSKEERIPSRTLSYYTNRSRAPSSQTYRSRGEASNSEEDVLSTITPSSMTTMTEGTTSHLTVDSSRIGRSNRTAVTGRRGEQAINSRSSSCPRPATDDISSLEYAEFARDNPSPVLGRRYTNGTDKTIQTPRLSQRFVQSGFYRDQNGYKPPPKPPRGLRTKTLHRDKLSPSPSDSKSTSDYGKLSPRPAPRSQPPVVRDIPDIARDSPSTDFHKILMRLDLRDNPPSEYDKMKMRMSNGDLQRTDFEKIKMRIPTETTTMNGHGHASSHSSSNLSREPGIPKSPPVPLPKYQFGQNEKSFQTNPGDSPGDNLSSRDSSNKSLNAKSPREMVTVSHTVDFSSEEGDSIQNGYDTEEDRIRIKREIRQRKNNLINHQMSLTKTESAPKKEMGTMTEKKTWPRRLEHSSDDVEDSDTYHRRFSKNKQQTDIKTSHSRMRRDSLEEPSTADLSSESDLNGPMEHPKYVRNTDKGVWVHPSVFEGEASRAPYEREYAKKQNGFQIMRSDYAASSGRPFLDRNDQSYDKRDAPVDEEDEEIIGNGTSRVTISVPYYRESTSSQMSNSSYPNSRTNHHPHGVRSFHRSDQVRNWSTVSVTSDQSYQGSSTLPMVRVPKHQNHKVIRWSSVERLPRKRNLFTTIKRFSVRSLTRAKLKTGQLLNSLKTRMKTEKQKKSLDTTTTNNSGDSAYDTAEVCLRPDGNGLQTNLKKKKRRQSWSFHDLRTEFPTGRPVHKRQQHGSNTSLNAKGAGSPGGSGNSSNSARELVTRKKKRKQQYNSSRARNNDSSDSGVEEYPSDYSEAIGAQMRANRLRTNRRAESDPEHLASEVSLVSVNHGRSHGRRNYSRWSQTDLHGELGYIP